MNATELQAEFCEYLDEKYQKAIVRYYDNDTVELAFNFSSLGDQTQEFSKEDIHDAFEFKNIMFSGHGVSMIFEEEGFDGGT